MKHNIIRIVAAKGAARDIEYEMRDPEEPGSVPGWFPGVILLLRDEIQDDEKIVIQDRIIKIVKKTPVDRFLDWVRRRRPAGEIKLREEMDSVQPAQDKGSRH